MKSRGLDQHRINMLLILLQSSVPSQPVGIIFTLARLNVQSPVIPTIFQAYSLTRKFQMFRQTKYLIYFLPPEFDTRNLLFILSIFIIAQINICLLKQTRQSTINIISNIFCLSLLSNYTVLTNCEHSLLMLTAIVQLNGTHKIYTERFQAFSSLFYENIIIQLLIIIIFESLFAVEFKLQENLNQSQSHNLVII